VKKIDQLVLRNFVGPFLLTFFITLFIFVMQFLWMYIDDLVGKGLEWHIVMELISLASASFVPLVLPLAVLLSSIMTYGNLGEHYELVAMKAAGMSLYRFLLPLIIVAVIISASAFYFANNILPQANLKFGALLSTVRNQKPALNIKEGIFYTDIEGFSIRVSDKEDDNRTIHDVLIYDHTDGNNDNVLSAKTGEMFTQSNNRYLVLRLYDGHRYSEGKPGIGGKQLYEHYSTHFNVFEKWFDLSDLEFQKQDESSWSNHYRMLNMSQLQSAIDTLEYSKNKRISEYQSNVSQFLKVRDPYLDTVITVGLDTCLVDEWMSDLIAFPTKDRELQAYEKALQEARNVKSFSGVATRDLEYRLKNIRKHKVEWHRKIALSFACLVMFMIGAPLGAIIRKGGLGFPLLISITLFVVFHVTSMTGEKMAEKGVLDPFMGIWLPNFILLPLGIFLLIKARDDSPLFTMDWYFGFVRRFKERNSNHAKPSA
jgi:lipopolysaccharide export system permease protein